MEVQLPQLLFAICSLLRISTFVFFLPFFPEHQSARYAKLILALTLSLIFCTVLPKPAIDLEWNPVFIFICLQEVTVGAVMGFVVFLIGGAFRTIGSLLSQLMGLEIAQTLDPGSGAPGSMMSNFFFYMGIAVLFSLDAHHYLLSALAHSFTVIPPGEFSLRPELFQLVFFQWQTFFRFALVVVAPFFLLSFAIAVQMGILGRMVPQMNVFLMEYPLRLGISLVLLAWFLPSLFSGIRAVFALFANIFSTLLQ